MTEIKLPTLPTPSPLREHRSDYSAGEMQAYATAAIEADRKLQYRPVYEEGWKDALEWADRKRRGEPTDSTGYTLGPVSDGGFDPRGRGEPVGPAICATCGGSGMVDDGEIDCYENGEPYENGPIKCVKDCPDCAPQPQQIPEDHSGSTQMFLDALTLARDNARGFMNKTGPDTDSLPDIDLAIDTARAMLESAPEVKG